MHITISKYNRIKVQNNQGTTDICVKCPSIKASIPTKDNKVYII